MTSNQVFEILKVSPSKVRNQKVYLPVEQQYSDVSVSTYSCDGKYIEIAYDRGKVGIKSFNTIIKAE
ncbi:MAG: hypothetical protein IT221_09510 [Fluviicola sp.]|nr:hypothetical protein [Fluviicola sp.]